MHNNRKYALGKNDAKSHEGAFLGYSSYNKAYKVYNKSNLVCRRKCACDFDETNHLAEKSSQDDDHDDKIGLT